MLIKFGLADSKETVMVDITKIEYDENTKEMTLCSSQSDVYKSKKGISNDKADKIFDELYETGRFNFTKYPVLGGTRFIKYKAI